MNCHNCGTPLAKNAAVCRLCGVAQKPSKAQPGKRKRTLPRWFFMAVAAAAAVVTAGISVFSAIVIAQMAFTPRETVIVMEDANLEKAVCDYLEITDGSLTVEGVKDVVTLDLKGKDITDIAPLAHFTGLERLYLDGNSIDNIGALAGLDQLKELTLSGNNIIDLTPLSGLTGLRSLSLDGNNISDISALAGMANLETLELGGNRISNIAALADMANLEVLELSGNNISDITPLAGCAGLKHLSLENNPVEDIGALARLKALKLINIKNTRVRDVSAVAGKAEIKIGSLPKLELMLGVGAYFRLDQLKLPLDVGSAAINWTSSDADVVSVTDGKAQATSVQSDIFSGFSRQCTLEGKVNNTDIVFTCDITVAHDKFFIDVEDSKTKYKSAGMVITGYCWAIEPKIENVIGLELEYDITVTKGSLDQFALRAYINDEKWQNFGEISVKSSAAGRLSIEFDEPVSISKYWLVTADKKTGQWNDFVCIDKIIYAQEEADIDAAQQAAKALPEAV